MTDTGQATMAPGIYRDVPMDEYHEWDAVSNSRLSKLRRSPAHLRAYIDGEAKDTAPMALGRAIHTAVLEGDAFAARYAVASQCAALTKQGKRCSKIGSVPLVSNRAACGIHARDYAQERDHTREILSGDDWDRCFGIRCAIHGIERAHAILRELQDVELSLCWEDPDTGLPCKARWDGYAPAAGGCIIDLKSTRDASRAAFEREIFARGYHCQGAHYLRAAAAHGIEGAHYLIVAVEKDPPYGTCLYRLTEEAIAAGETQNAPLMQRYAECIEKDSWPGYNDGEVVDIGLPDWAWKLIEEEVS